MGYIIVLENLDIGATTTPSSHSSAPTPSAFKASYAPSSAKVPTGASGGATTVKRNGVDMVKEVKSGYTVYTPVSKWDTAQKYVAPLNKALEEARVKNLPSQQVKKNIEKATKGELTSKEKAPAAAKVPKEKAAPTPSQDFSQQQQMPFQQYAQPAPSQDWLSFDLDDRFFDFEI